MTAELTHEEKKTLARCSCSHLIASHDGSGCMAPRSR